MELSVVFSHMETEEQDGPAQTTQRSKKTKIEQRANLMADMSKGGSGRRRMFVCGSFFNSSPEAHSIIRLSREHKYVNSTTLGTNLSNFSFKTLEKEICNSDFLRSKCFNMMRFNNLPNEIILEILTRLPTDSVLECKLVCKPWRDLIHLPSFSHKHLNHLNSDDDDSGKLSFVFLNRLIIGEYTKTDEFSYAEYDENSHEIPFSRKKIMNVNLPLYECNYDYSFAGSCNGLICIDSWYNDFYGPTYIFNPITREYIMLPTSQGSYYWSGFGYIPSTNEYKVVRIYNSCGYSNVRFSNVQVYTLGSSSGWRNVGTMDRIMQFYKRDAGAFVNGAIHWADDEGTILSFHLANEKFSKLPSPPWFTRSEFSTFPISLGVLGDFLSATYYCNVHHSEMWLFKKNKDNNDFSWSEDYSFDIRILQNSPPFGFTKSGRLLSHENHKIYGYDPNASSAKMNVNFGKLINAAIPHRNTLVSLKALGEKDAKIMESGERAGTSEE